MFQSNFNSLFIIVEADKFSLPIYKSLSFRSESNTVSLTHSFPNPPHLLSVSRDLGIFL